MNYTRGVISVLYMRQNWVCSKYHSECSLFILGTLGFTLGSSLGFSGSENETNSEGVKLSLIIQSHGSHRNKMETKSIVLSAETYRKEVDQTSSYDFIDENCLAV